MEFRRIASAAALSVVASAVMASACESRARTSPTPSAGTEEAGADACLDRWLAEHDLDAFGSPRDTAYAGGTPLFDEATSTSRSRWDYVSSRHPEVARACERAPSAIPSRARP